MGRKAEFRKSIAIVNRNFPPNKGITGLSAYELARFFIDNYFIEVEVITTRGTYDGIGVDKTLNTNGIKFHYVNAIYGGKNKILRLFSSLVEGFTLIRRLKKRNVDEPIVMTDPPFLTFWASILMPSNSWHLWSMDIYPDAFIAGKLLKSENPLYKAIHSIVYKKLPKSILALGPVQLKYLENNYKVSFKGKNVILPCGVYEHEASIDLPSWYNSSLITFGYCGNLGEAHSPEFIIEIIKQLDPKKHQIILVLYGKKATIVKNYIGKGKEGVIMLDFVDRTQLGYIDIHLVSLLSNWKNVCVPSKAVSAICSESAFLFYGSRNCDNWYLLKKGGWLINEEGNLQEEVAGFFKELSRDKVLDKKKNSEEVAKELSEIKQDSFVSFANKYLLNSNSTKI